MKDERSKAERSKADRSKDGRRKAQRNDDAGKKARHNYDRLDRVLHEKARLGVVVALLNRPDGVLFPDLKELCDLTDGNLSRHLAVLAEAGVVEIWKAQDGPRSRTLARLTTEGRALFFRYLSELERVVEDARASENLSRRKSDLGPSWAPA